MERLRGTRKWAIITKTGPRIARASLGGPVKQDLITNNKRIIQIMKKKKSKIKLNRIK